MTSGGFTMTPGRRSRIGLLIQHGIGSAEVAISFVDEHDNRAN
jgi:hypothetical protein